MIGCLVIHGYTGGPYEVEPLVDYLKQQTDWDIVVPTLPGHGMKLELENVSHKKWLRTAEDVMEDLQSKYETIYVIGFSMGGMIAAYLAGKYKIDKLVLLAPAGKFLSFKQMTLDLGEVISDGFRGKLKENANYLHYKNKIRQVPLKANLEFIKLVRYTRGSLKNIQSPVFIAQGQQDSVVPPSTVHYLDKEILSEQKEVVLFENSRHMICHGDDKDTLNTMIGDFLSIEKTKK